MSEDAFRCPECSSTFLDCTYLDVGEGVYMELECSRCSCTWPIAGYPTDFSRV